MAYDKTALLAEAAKASELAYAPYSRCRVGAALLGASGKIYPGCNIENASYPAGICAERAALARAVSEGEREFAAIAVSGSGADGKPGFFPPCGICRQALAEFCDPASFEIVLLGADGPRVFTLADLLPEGFGPKYL